MSEGPSHLESKLIDLSRVSLADLRSLDNPVLVRSLQRLLSKAEKQRDAIASWDSAI